MKTLALDFEFRNSAEKIMEVVCAAIRWDEKTEKFDLRRPIGRAAFKQIFNRLTKDEGRPIICFFASAETRALLSLGYSTVELLDLKWIDIHPLWRMLTHSHPNFRYGRIWDKSKNKFIVSEKPPFGEDKDVWEEDDDGELTVVSKVPWKHRPVGTGLADAVAHQLGLVMDTDHKAQMRELILSKNKYTDEEFEAILDYCAKDVEFLLPLLRQLLKSYHDITDCTVHHLMALSTYSVCMGIVEAEGIPVDVRKMEALSQNFLALDKALVDDCNEIYPFYTWVKPSKQDKLKGWGDLKPQEKDTVWKEFLVNANLLEQWPKSEKTGKPQKTKEVMEDYSGHEAVAVYANCRKQRKQLQYFSPWGFDRIAKNIGRDCRIRTLLGAFGTKTGRNAPSVKSGYLLAMSSWLRPLITAPEGYVILGADFSAQEIALQGWVSDDDSFMAAYASGDPYTWLAQTAGLMRDDVVRGADGKFRFDGTLIEGEEADELKNIRNLVKALLLGIGFGMGRVKLAKQLTMAKLRGLSKDKKAKVRLSLLPTTAEAERMEGLDIIAECTVWADMDTAPYGVDRNSVATTYTDLHKKIFKDYWSWRTEILKEYDQKLHLSLPDGWCLLEGEDRPNTVANFKVQGLGAVILRKAVELCIRAGLRVFAPLHDAIYIIAKESEKEKAGELLCKCMREAVLEFTGDIDLIRIDWEEYKTDWEEFKSKWTADKGGYDFQKFGKWMMPQGFTDIKDVPKPSFEEETHTYSFRGKILNRSVSVAISSVQEDFDAEFWSMKKSKNDAIEAAKLRKEWDEKRDKAALKGTLAHHKLEHAVREKLMGESGWDEEALEKVIASYQEFPFFGDALGAANLSVPKLWDEFQKYCDEKGYSVAETECRMVHPEFLLAGTADLILKRDGKYRIADWKTNEKIHKKAFGNLLSPMQHLPNDKLAVYSLQMSLYRIILEERWGVGPWEDGHTICWGSDGEAEIIEIPHRPEARLLLDK